MPKLKLKSSSKVTKLTLKQTKNVENPMKKIKIPSTMALVYEALVELDNKKTNGSSFKEIKKYITNNYAVDIKKLSPTCKQILKQEIDVGNIVQVGRKFLLTVQKKDHRFVKPRRFKNQPKNDVEVEVVNKKKEPTTVKTGKVIGKVK